MKLFRRLTTCLLAAAFTLMLNAQNVRAGPADFVQAMQPLSTIYKQTQLLLASTFESDNVLGATGYTKDQRIAEIDRRHRQIASQAETLSAALERFQIDSSRLSPKEVALLEAIIEKCEELFVALDDHMEAQAALVRASGTEALRLQQSFALGSMERRLSLTDGQIAFQTAVKESDKNLMSRNRLGFSIHLLEADRAMIMQLKSALEQASSFTQGTAGAFMSEHRQAVRDAASAIDLQETALRSFAAKGAPGTDPTVFDGWISAYEESLRLQRDAIGIYHRYRQAIWTEDGQVRALDQLVTEPLDRELGLLGDALAKQDLKVIDLSARLVTGTQRN